MSSDDRRRGREPLTRTRILETALALVDREGAEALTMRRLGRELDVAAMSLYNHVPGREALLDGLSEVMVGQIGMQRAGDGPRDALLQLVSGIRAVALAHPAAFRLVGMRPLRSLDAFHPLETAFRALRALGLAGEEAVHAYRVLVSYARGFALAEIAGFTLEWPLELPAGRFPHVVELGPHLAASDHDAAFALGAELLLAGLEERAQGDPGGVPAHRSAR